LINLWNYKKIGSEFLVKKFKFSKENISIALVVLLSAILNLGNLGIEGTANSYYAAAVKSMTVNLKNFFFVSFDPTGFVTIDKPPLGYWFQAISAKIFGFSGWSILLPQAVAGVLSVIVLYRIVKRSFGHIAALIAALCMAITPVFVAASRNNTVDNMLVLFLLLSCSALTKAAEKGKLKYLIISMVLLGLGFNVKMLQAYMIGPALYITYLLSTSISFKKRIVHLVLGSVILLAVSLSWALIVDAIPTQYRPYVDSSTNNTVMELIVGHNGLERISLGGSSSGNGGPGGRTGMQQKSTNSSTSSSSSSETQNNQNLPGNPPEGDGQMAPPNSSNSTQSGDNKNFKGNPPSDGRQMGGGMMGGNGGGSQGLQGTFGGQTAAGLTRLFSKNILSDQIVWFILLAIFGFIAAAIKEKLKFLLDNDKKQQLVLWFMWFLPSFIYFSYNTGTFHSYYLTMLAAPTAALAGIGLVSMWELYKKGAWASWFLPAALMANGAVHLLMLYYFISSASIVKVLMVIVAILCFGCSLALAVLNVVKKNDNIKVKSALAALALTGLLVTPFVGSSTVLTHKLNGSFPAAGLELLSSSAQNMGAMSNSSENADSKLIEFLQKNKTANQKYLLVVSNSNSASDIIINTDESVMSLGGFLGSNKPLTLDQFKELVKKGEIRYVMGGGQGGNSSSEIMNWVQQNGTLVSSSEYSDSSTTQNSSNTQSSTDYRMQNHGGQGGSGQLYDLKAYTDSASSK
jgi:4-amino-4-deoxy-L-arabinose transferase-like glycosyltransferase